MLYWWRVALILPLLVLGCSADAPGDGDPCGGDPDCIPPADRDGDGVIDALDPFPDDPAEWGDADGDGVGDVADDDDDDDGVPDDADERPFTPDIHIVDAAPELVLVGQAVDFDVLAVSIFDAEVAVTMEEGPAGASFDGVAVHFTAAAPGEQLFHFVAIDGLATVRRVLRVVAVAGTTAAEGVVGTDGGILEVTDVASPVHGAMLAIPPGAVAADTPVRISAVDTGGAELGLPGSTPTEGLLLLEPEGLVFGLPVDLRFPAAVTGAFDRPEDVVAVARSPGVAYSLRPEIVRREADGWHADIMGFSVHGLEEGAPPDRHSLVSGPTAVDRRAQELAVQCANRLSCGICYAETSACGAFASLARCLFEAYQEASEEVWFDTGVLLSPMSTRYLASLYDLTVDPTLKFWLLSFLGEDGPAGGRPNFLKTHDDGAWGTGFRVFDPNDSDRTGRHDHFVTMAQVPPVGWVIETLFGDESTNDLRINSLGRSFGVRVRTHQIWGADEIERWLKTNLCEEVEPTPPMECAGGSGPAGCCPAPPTTECTSCAHLWGCGFCEGSSTCQLREANTCEGALIQSGSAGLNETTARRLLASACMMPVPECSAAGAACGAAGQSCCEGLECVLGDCYDCASTGRVGDGCDPADPAACCGAIACSPKGSASDFRCCLRDEDPCTSSAECCGGMQCVSGACRCGGPGASCLTGIECCGGSICTDGRCS